MRSGDNRDLRLCRDPRTDATFMDLQGWLKLTTASPPAAEG